MKGLPPIALHIEHIVIDGVALTRTQAHQLQGAMERELARLLGERTPAQLQTTLPAHAGRTAITAPVVDLTTPVRPLDLGRAIARSVHASLTRDA